MLVSSCQMQWAWRMGPALSCVSSVLSCVLTAVSSRVSVYLSVYTVYYSSTLLSLKPYTHDLYKELYTVSVQATRKHAYTVNS